MQSSVFYFAVGDNRRGRFLKLLRPVKLLQNKAIAITCQQIVRQGLFRFEVDTFAILPFLAFGNTKIGNISPPRINLLQLTCYYNNTMISLEELENQCLPISQLKKYATEWVIKVLVIRRSLTKEYKNADGEGIRWQLILVDEEDLELAFMNNTEVVEDKSQFKTEQFSNGFNSFDEAEKIINGSLFVQALTREGRSVRREVIVTNESEQSPRMGSVPIGIGKNCHTKRVIIDKNARIGDNVKIINIDNIQEAARESDGYFIKSEIVTVIEDVVIPSGTII
ncbi:hypothetical protein KY290_011632 [Solanum tuberosum]|uniref:Glucose-1-phosphate adenylyltransferase n=1 Tax=Solanum tuberosum TaxID=4113 RepID=A0ABQ7W3D6_SOLTU|nr:hypothetical protein KY290_011632 [Solanum tuberosum]